MKNNLTKCEGNNCPSKKNCKRYVERDTFTIPAALYVRRGPGDSACDMYSPIKIVSTFNEKKGGH